MKIDKSFLRSRVARRIFFQFVLCALLPISILALLAYSEVSGYLHETAIERLEQSAKLAGMDLFNRLNSCAESLRRQANQQAQGLPLRVDTDHPDCFSGWQRFRPDGSRLAAGRLSGRPEFSDEQLRMIFAGQTVIRAESEPHGTPRMSMNIALDTARPELGIFRGELALSPAWIANSLGEYGNLCLLGDAQSKPICASEPGAAFSGAASRGVAGRTSGHFEWRDSKRAYLAGYWSLFLNARFHAPSWTVIISESADEALGPISVFRETFPLAILFSLSLVLLLSLVQIRRSLVPLEKLHESTLRIADGRFDSRVEISTKDEFGQLGASFNSMATRIGLQMERLEQMHLGTLTTLARAIDAKSQWTAGHSERVTDTAVHIGAAMGLPPAELEMLHRGGLLHDIGKIGTPATILDKPGKLDEEEMRIMRDHVRMGARILEPLPGFEDILPIVLHHHEWFNGKGYPAGLSGEEISLHGRIFAVADVYDALISDRPYRAGWARARGIEFIRNSSGTQFDPQVVPVFLRLMEEEDRMRERTPALTGNEVEETRQLVPASEGAV